MAYTLTGLGTALPPFSLSSEQMAVFTTPLCCETPAQAETLQTLFANSGVRRKHSALLEGDSVGNDIRQSFYPVGSGGRGPSTAQRMQAYEKLAPPLALEASQRALQYAQRPPADVTHLVTVSCTGFTAPGIDMSLISGLDLKPTTERIHVGYMGCHGAINGLRVARGLLAADPEAVVLVSAVELCTLHFYSGWDPEKIVANALFADGAASAVLQNSEHAPAHSAGWKLAAVGSVRIPDSAAAMSWRVGDFGFEMGLSRRIPELIRRHLRPWMEGWLEKQGLRIDQIQSWAVHPGGPKILEATELALQLPEAALATSRGILAECGNMSSPTVLFILDRLRRQGGRQPCVMLGFGPGMVAEAALFV
ncbi:MAG: type III polyketide synthase [Planctomycetes bacterium]|nr:type III polyketide synthase [Planctomycetota bacterium]